MNTSTILEALQHERRRHSKELDRIERMLAGETVDEEPDDIDKQIIHALFEAHDHQTANQVCDALPKLNWQTIRLHLKKLETSGRVIKRIGKSSHSGGRRPHLFELSEGMVNDIESGWPHDA